VHFSFWRRSPGAVARVIAGNIVSGFSMIGLLVLINIVLQGRPVSREVVFWHLLVFASWRLSVVVALIFPHAAWARFAFRSADAFGHKDCCSAIAVFGKILGYPGY
jgi:hypothetical protein